MFHKLSSIFLPLKCIASRQLLTRYLVYGSVLSIKNTRKSPNGGSETIFVDVILITWCCTVFNFSRVLTMNVCQYAVLMGKVIFSVNNRTGNQYERIPPFKLKPIQIVCISHLHIMK